MIIPDGAGPLWVPHKTIFLTGLWGGNQKKGFLFENQLVDGACLNQFILIWIFWGQVKTNLL